MNNIWIFPCLGEQSQQDVPSPNIKRPYPREGTIIPEIALVREAVANETKLALLDILLDRVEELFFGDLAINHGISSAS
jgi:hypothetical protein